jgi:hypothetical protein
MGGIVDDQNTPERTERRAAKKPKKKQQFPSSLARPYEAGSAISSFVSRCHCSIFFRKPLCTAA